MESSKNKKTSVKSLKSNVNERGLRTVVKNLLKQDKRLWTSEGKLIENKLIEFVQKDDENIIKLLLSDSLTKDAFFQKISSIFVFKKDDFINFETMSEFLNGSYTNYSKHIGLANNYSLLKNAGEVVLNFPYKDCFLEGGQEKVSEGRDEIFYNKILAREEINRLEEEKVFTNWIKYTEKGGKKVDSFDHKKDNLILRGNNLLALYSLLPKYRGQINLIYIDPPYNTGTDDFNYNDNFNHSSWLVFMKNRLEVAKKLLRDDGVIFVQCDDHEQAYLKVVMDEIFNGGFINSIAVKMSELSGTKMAHYDKKLPKIKEYLLVYKKVTFKLRDVRIIKTEWDDEYNLYLENFDDNLLDLITESDENKIDEVNKKLLNVKILGIKEAFNKYKNKNEDFDDFRFRNINFIVRTSPSSSVKKIADILNIKNQIVYALLSKRDKNIIIIRTDYNKAVKDPRIQIVFARDSFEQKIGDMWTDINTTGLHTEGGVTLEGGKKPEKLLNRIIEMSTKIGDIVLDYHLGSGTTCAVAHKLGRKYIGIEQLDYGKDDSVIRLNNVIKGDKSGISGLADWKGGGSFVYAELAQWNEEYIQEIKKAKTVKDLTKIYEKMIKEAFFVYTFDQSKWNNKKFEELTIDNQKKILFELLNMNHLYINYKDIEDATYKISKEDIKLNKNFYE